MFRKLVCVLSITVFAAALNAPAFALEPIRGWASDEANIPGAPSNDPGAKPPIGDRRSCGVPCVCEDDGLACTLEGVPVCECTHEILPGFCVIDGACVAEGAPSPDNSCLACNPAISQTSYTPRVGPCDDHDLCTTVDQCDDGYCFGGGLPNCDDSNLCTIDSCNTPTGCASLPKDCSDAVACNIDSCNPATGACVHSKKSIRLAYTGPGVALRMRPIVLSAFVTENGSTPVAAGRSVTFRVVTQICVATTDANGVARCSLVINQTPGAKAVSMSFAGDACYLAASRSDTLWVQ